MENFKKLGLSPNTLETLKNKGFEEPTEIQELVIPIILKDETDVIAQAQTGTGKTAAFGLPLIEKLKKNNSVQAIIIAPTRELVLQVTEEIQSLRGDNPLSIVTIYGGQSIDLQFQKLKRGADIVVGTPGRVIDHLNRGTLNISNVRYFILDEADEMLNMGFLEDIEIIFEKTPKEKRVMLFSATMPERIIKLAENYMGKYTIIKTKTKLTTNLTEQIYFEVNGRDKLEALTRIIDIETKFYGIVFCRTKIEVDEITTKLTEKGYFVDGLHGDISQAQRERTLKKFKQETISILIATDVAARGIDVDNLTHVINYSIPQNPEAYVHRIGRTGRAGKKGTAITFITPSEFRKLGFIRKITNSDIKKETVPQIKDIIKSKKDKIEEDIKGNILENKNKAYLEWAKSIIENNSEKTVEDIMASILKLSYGKDLDESNYQKIKILEDRNKNINTDRDKRETRENIPLNGKTRLFIAKGSVANIDSSSLIEFISKKVKLPKDIIEDIDIHENFSFITVPFKDAEKILEAFGDVKSGSKPLIEEANQKPRGRERVRVRGKEGVYKGTKPSYGDKEKVGNSNRRNSKYRKK
jgi:ATP-dependent RNA helicase DeaD